MIKSCYTSSRRRPSFEEDSEQEAVIRTNVSHRGLIFSGLKVKTMKLLYLLAPTQFLRLVKTPKIISHIKFFLYFFFKTREKIPRQLLKSLVVSTPKRVFGVNREKLSLHYISRQCEREEISVSNDFS